MPLYEYRCPKCAARFERLQRFSDPAVQRCPQCHRARPLRMIGRGVSVIFQGSGFYSTDTRRTPVQDRGA